MKLNIVVFRESVTLSTNEERLRVRRAGVRDGQAHIYPELRIEDGRVWFEAGRWTPEENVRWCEPAVEQAPLRVVPPPVQQQGKKR